MLQRGARNLGRDVSKYIVSLQCHPAVNYNFTLFCESFASPCIII